MYFQILSNKQEDLLPAISDFSSDFHLVGGTAIALQLGHRRSIDYDLFANRPFKSEQVLDKFRKIYSIQQILIENSNELTFVVNDVRLTFYNYPFRIKSSVWLKEYISMPDILTLSAMKAHALGRRAKWKDYIDLYYILKNHKLEEIVNKANEIFKSEFNEKLFRVQLSYYEDIDYSEEVEYMPGFEVSKEEVKKFLTNLSTQ